MYNQTKYLSRRRILTPLRQDVAKTELARHRPHSGARRQNIAVLQSSFIGDEHQQLSLNMD